MRKAIVVSLLSLFLTSFVCSQEKSIADPVEAAAYKDALYTTPLLESAAAFERFVDKYPTSVANIEALENAMTIYLRFDKRNDVYRVAERILGIEPLHVRALGVLAMLKRADAENDFPSAAADARKYGLKGLEALEHWRPPMQMPREEASRTRDDMTVLFGGACGYGAFVAGEFAAARNCYLRSVRVRTAASNVKDIYQLGLVEVELERVSGYWYLGKADGLVRRNPQLTKLSAGGHTPADRQARYFRQMLVTGRDKYREFHGVEFGWDKLVAATLSEPLPPRWFTVKPAAVAAQDAVLKVTAPGVDPANLSFCQWEEVLAFRDTSPANKQAAERVWETIKNHQQANLVEQRIPVKILAVAKDEVVAAVCKENQNIDHSDLTVKLKVQLIAPPPVGSIIDALGMFSDYTPDPFMLIMKGQPLPPGPGTPAGQVKAAK